MTAYAMMPTFTDKTGYLHWRNGWSTVYMELSNQIRIIKKKVNETHRAGESAKEIYNRLIHHQAVAYKMMTLLGEAKLRWQRIREMKQQIKDQPFPLHIEDCRNVDFHYNKGHGEFPFLPMWTIRAKGKSYYVHNVDCSVRWTTRARVNGSTKGVIRLARCNLKIDEEGNAFLT